ncbi:DUF6344 domain-containing protein [Streptomyces qinzhouensis]|uniref:Uncharacterized protein n=1 Tax=Streptomyces qinzhouensis TaxID=2599401 RepID=A0A5B8IHR9_9ACTN|nr:DUF6344 domain-containing protein [Streptomyces qinzhouensis]QDY77842.1 hypothetical protein FQU76_16535 [Streptomyces qinzhouensis]
MTAQKVRDLWSAFLATLVALLAALGFSGAAAARTQPAVGAPAEPVLPSLGADSPAGVTAAAEGPAPDPAVSPDVPPRGRADGRARELSPARVGELVRERERRGTVRSLLSLLIPSQTQRWNAGPREKALPPTIKQRIGAEAHGSSPSVRRIPLYDTDAPVPGAAPETAAADHAPASGGSSADGTGETPGTSGRTADRTVVPAARSSFTTAA